MSAITANLQAVLRRIDDAARVVGRNPDTIALLAVSKTWPAKCVWEAALAGQRAFGENYVQEGVEKIARLRESAASGLAEENAAEPSNDLPVSTNGPAVGVASPPAGPLLQPLEWHFIGPLQSNKTRSVAECFEWVHSIERLRVAERLSAQRPEHLPPLQVCVQVNVSGEASKSGCPPEEAAALCRQVAALPGLRLRGLMAIPAPVEGFAAQRTPFQRLREIFEQLRAEGLSLDTLSMGMSHDLEAAIAEGATLVRVGTAIFGERNYR